jgi:hypothetical protein
VARKKTCPWGYPEESLARAITIKDQVRLHLSNQVEPAEIKKQQKNTAKHNAEHSFQHQTREGDPG